MGCIDLERVIRLKKSHHKTSLIHLLIHSFVFLILGFVVTSQESG